MNGFSSYTHTIDAKLFFSVQIIRRIDTRIPTPLLSVSLATSAAPPSSLGKLGDLRGGLRPATALTSRPVSAPGGRWASLARPSSSVASTPTPTPVRVASPAATQVNAGLSRSRVGVRPVAGIVQGPDVGNVGGNEDIAVPDDWEDEA